MPTQTNTPNTTQQSNDSTQVLNTPSNKLLVIDAELKQIELESAKLKLELDRANLVDMRERLAERELKRDQIRQDARTKGAVITRENLDRSKQQAVCNHRKGGNGAHGVVAGQGDDNQYAVLKHTFANGDTWIRCLRCGKTWKPPIKSQFKDEASLNAAIAVYREALNFQTRNVSSKGVMFQFSDGGEFYREQTAQVTLR